MSFGGHALDMIMRTKLNREQLKLRRERQKDIMKRKSGSGDSYKDSTVTAEQMEEIIRQTKEYEQERKDYTFRMKFIFFGIIAVAAIGLLIIFKLFLS